MLSITIDVNGVPVEVIDVVNRGPVGGTYDHGDHPGGGGLRVYEWSVRPAPSKVRRVVERGTVEHQRDAGATQLALQVLASLRLAREKRQPRLR